MSNIPTVMALFDHNMLSEKEVVSWADEQLLEESEPFEYISMLSLKGPTFCAKLPDYEFPSARVFSFIEEFALRTKDLNRQSRESMDNFLRWVSTECMGRDIDIPEVNFGYHVDHYFFECDDVKFANKFLNEELAVLVPKNAKIAEEIWSLIA